MTTVNDFVRRLNGAGPLVRRYGDVILERFGDIVAEEVEAHAPKRTRREPGSGLTQTSPGVLELTDGYLVGEVRGTSRSAPQSRTFLTRSFEGVSGPLAAAVAEVALSALADEVTIRPRR